MWEGECICVCMCVRLFTNFSVKRSRTCRLYVYFFLCIVCLFLTYYCLWTVFKMYNTFLLKFMKWMNKRMKCDWIIKVLINWVNEWMSEWVNEWINEWMKKLWIKSQIWTMIGLYLLFRRITLCKWYFWC
jgi:hypothetical protein